MMKLLQPAMLLLLLPALLALKLRPLPGKWLNKLRLLIYLLLILALAQPVVWNLSRGGAVIVLADHSASMPDGSHAQQVNLINTIEKSKSRGDRLGVISFGSRPAIEHPLQDAPFQGFVAEHNRDASNLAEALDSALALLPRNENGRILVISDGRYTGRDPRESAGLAATRKIAIDYRLMSRQAANDLAISRVDAPQEVTGDNPFVITAWIVSPTDQMISYRLQRGSTLIAEGTQQVKRGQSPLLFRDRPAADTESKVNGYQLTISSDAKDPIPENNRARFLVTTSGSKPLLCIAASPDSHLPALLSGSGHPVNVREPHEIDGRLETLAGYSGIIIENCRAEKIGLNLMETIAAWVKDYGAGLLITGGRNSYGIGGYYRSPLEEALPFSLELRREHRKFSMAIVVVLDRSGSMTMPASGGRTKMDLANLATVESLGLLSDYDEMAVLAVDTAAHVIIPRSPVNKVRRQQSNILNIQSMGGGIFVYTGLQAAIKQLQGTTAGIKHILLFSDAADSEEPGQYRELLAAAREEDITCSVVGLGSRADKDAEFLLDIATRGNGQCFFSNDAMEIPRLFAQDTFMVARNTWITNQVLPRFTAALGSLSDRLPADAPPVGGYNLCYAKADATVVALSRDEHDAPLLALRHYGIGHVAAFTGEADGHDAGPFARWSEIGEFYAALARYCAGASQQLAADGLYVRQRLIPGGVRVEVYIDPKHPTLPHLEELTLHAVSHGYGSAPKANQLSMHWRNTHTLSADVALQGNETLLATIILPDGKAHSLPPVALPYSPEHTPDNNNEGRTLLAELAAATDGSALADVGDIWQRLPRSRKAIPLASWAYLLAALLFLIEIFERRTYWLERNIFVQSRRPQRAATPPDKTDVKKASGRQRQLKEEDESVPLPEEASTTAAPESPLQQAKRRARERTR